ncbi:unnamed protein product [marine sediment metagenome]|uniref:Uncharacterized protein n=1 Tax=marine sediment metagenome TaxID=412755 RepID=X1MVV0_9ZZZZ
MLISVAWSKVLFISGVAVDIEGGNFSATMRTFVRNVPEEKPGNFLNPLKKTLDIFQLRLMAGAKKDLDFSP